MKIDRRPGNFIFFATAMATASVLIVPASAALLVHEPFDYRNAITGEIAANQLIVGQNGGIGFDGAWNQNGFGRDIQTGRTSFADGSGSTINSDAGLDFPGIASSGSALSRFGNQGQRQAHRILSSNAQAALTQDNTTIWFSLIMSATTNTDALVATFIFGNDAFYVNDESFDTASGNLRSAGDAFGVGFRQDQNGQWSAGTGTPNAVAFVGSTTSTVDVANAFSPSAQPDATHQDPILVVGKINWNPAGTPDDLFIFAFSEMPESAPDESSAVASLTADFDQSTWNTIAYWDSGYSIVDEIRLGTSFESVTPIPEPSSALLVAMAGIGLLLRRGGFVGHG